MADPEALADAPAPDAVMAPNSDTEDMLQQLEETSQDGEDGLVVDEGGEQPASSACEGLAGIAGADTPSGGQPVIAKLLISNAAAGSVIGKARSTQQQRSQTTARPPHATHMPLAHCVRAHATTPALDAVSTTAGGSDHRADPKKLWRARAAVSSRRVLSWHERARAAAVRHAALGAHWRVPHAGEAAT